MGQVELSCSTLCVDARRVMYQKVIVIVIVMIMIISSISIIAIMIMIIAISMRVGSGPQHTDTPASAALTAFSGQTREEPIRVT
eukprot:1652367-Rhodomonas_salina.1